VSSPSRSIVDRVHIVVPVVVGDRGHFVDARHEPILFPRGRDLEEAMVRIQHLDQLLLAFDAHASELDGIDIQPVQPLARRRDGLLVPRPA
jgi:hypothetical protein